MALSEGLHSFHFLRPLWLLALPLLWALAAWLARRQAREGDWSRLIDAQLLPALRLDAAAQPRKSRLRQPWPWLALAWTLAVLALAGPSWQRDHSSAYRASAAWVLVLDLSPSMASDDLKPNRVTRARYALDDLLGEAHDARVGLVVFSAEPYTVTPLTDDVATVKTLLPPLAPDLMPTAGDNLAPALQQAGKLLEHSGARQQKVIVLTDGFDDPAAAFTAARTLRSHGVELSVIGVGTRDGAPLRDADGNFVDDAQGHPRMAQLDVDQLRSLADAGGGDYAGVTAMGGLLAGLQNDEPATASGTAAADVKLARWRDAGAWLLPALLLVSALLSRRGWL